ncbi:uncharacterized protein LOC126670310 [Mercurialis annua]|uniref:uncharacterized protein LOC126670310 n=1 Tax=Mercurialis annua TaxID=3986 RepID=UPI00215F02DF|nr:uncharacterized protein LOC126670310 [Mercurialis annua]
MVKEKRKEDPFGSGERSKWPENFRPGCKRPVEEFENFDRDESVVDAILSNELEKEGAVTTDNTATDNAASNNTGSDNAAPEMETDLVDSECDSTYVCGSKEDSDDVSVSDGGSDFDDEYATARQEKKKLRSNDIDTINGLGLDAMLDAPGGIASVNGKYWEGGAVGDIDAYAGCVESDPGSDYADTDDGLVTPNSSDEENLHPKKRKRRTRLHYNPKWRHEELEFKMHMTFLNRIQVKHAVQQWAICHGHDVRWKKSERLKVEARCAPGCSWRLYASRTKSCTSFRITGLNNEHMCQRASKNRQATSEWVAKEFLQKFRRQPSYKPKFMVGDLRAKYSGLVVPISCCYRAKYTAMTIIRGSLESHYTRFRAYDAEMRRVDPEGLFCFHFISDPTTGTPIFQRYYVGFSSLRKGFKAGCRAVLCVDGCFLKTLVVGVLLSAIARDANNQMYPVAWAIAEAENEETWTWFMELLISDIGFGEGLYLTLISDQQKGLKNAINKVVPLAEHRNCARHIYANWKKKHKDPELKRLFWKAVNTSNHPEFESVMDLIKAERVTAYDDFMKQLDNIFCKAFIRPDSKCDAITSNLVETFNGFISKSRQLQAINMLEDIRSSLMERMFVKSGLMDNHFEDICPRIRERIDKNQTMTRFCEAKVAKGAFQVSCGEDQYVVNLKNRSCSCRAWDISGIPCAHALVCINFMRYNVVDYVDDWYKKEKYKLAYEFCLQPINGCRMWPKVGGSSILPPPYRKMPGRPKKNRRRDPDEEPKKHPRFARKGVAMTCSHCLSEGHNKRACPDKANAPVERPKKRGPGRPRGPNWTPKPPKSGPSPSEIRKQRKKELLESTISAQRNASSSEQRSEVHTQLQNQVAENVGIRVNTSSGFIFARPAPNDGNRYVSGAMSTAAAVRRHNRPPTSLQEGSKTDAVSGAAISSQQGSTTNPGSRETTSVMFKSTASQAATPRVDKLPLRKGKQKMNQ